MLVLCHELNQHFAGTTKGAGHHYCIVYFTIVIIHYGVNWFAATLSKLLLAKKIYNVMNFRGILFHKFTNEEIGSSDCTTDSDRCENVNRRVVTVGSFSKKWGSIILKGRAKAGRTTSIRQSQSPISFVNAWLFTSSCWSMMPSPRKLYQANSTWAKGRVLGEAWRMSHVPIVCSKGARNSQNFGPAHTIDNCT